MQGITMAKIEIFIPVSHFYALRETLRAAGAGAFGYYDSVLSYSPVKGAGNIFDLLGSLRSVL